MRVSGAGARVGVAGPRLGGLSVSGRCRRFGRSAAGEIHDEVGDDLDAVIEAAGLRHLQSQRQDQRVGVPVVAPGEDLRQELFKRRRAQFGQHGDRGGRGSRPSQDLHVAVDRNGDVWTGSMFTDRVVRLVPGTGEFIERNGQPHGAGTHKGCPYMFLTRCCSRIAT